MPASDLREAIAAAFEDARQVPGAAYDPERFLAFLTAQPPPKGQRVADTFSGRRRFVRFMEAVQLQHGVCFNLEEWDRGYSLDAFAALVAAKTLEPRGSLTLARKYLRSASGRRVSDPFKFGFLSLPLVGLAVASSNLILRLSLLLAWLGIVSAVALIAWRGYAYAKALVARCAA